MSVCCDQHSGKPIASGDLVVALAGNPNSGKTTIFNALTGLRQRVANYPGVTVEKKTGRCRLPDGRRATIIDLPGTYSLISRSPDEQVAMEVLRGLRPDTPVPDVVVVVVDASNLQRNLYLVSQLVELGRPMVVALNMMDIAERRGVNVSPEILAEQLGVPVVPVVGHKRKGIDRLRQAIASARVAPMPGWQLPAPMQEELLTVSSALGGHGAGGLAMAERLLIGDPAEDVRRLASRPAVASAVRWSHQRLRQLGIDPMQADIEAHYRWIEAVADRACMSLDELAAMGNVGPGGGILDYASGRTSITERLDAVFMHGIWGLAVFAAIMATLFVSIFWLADPIMGGIESAIGALGQFVTARMPDGPLKALVTDGIFAGVGAVVVFVPQIALLFFFLAILEDSGYLARAAFLMDRLLARVGLHGKSFIPLLSSFACAIPGIMATRTIESPRERLRTILVAPFMSCSARLPVYTLLIGAFFASYGAMVRAGMMLSLYLVGILAAAGTAWLFSRRDRGPASAFILEMPSYKVPQAGQVFRVVWTSTWAFLAKAGTIIFCLSVILWAMTYYPRVPDPQAAPAEQLRHSIAGRIGQVLEPVIRPLGYDWKMGVGLVSAFAAREVFVSTMGIIYSAGDTDEDVTTLASAMRADQYPDGRPVWTPLVAVSLLVWFVLAMQCMSTLAVVRRETGTWRWPVFMLLYMNGLAYVVCLGIYQVGSFLTGG